MGEKIIVDNTKTPAYAATQTLLQTIAIDGGKVALPIDVRAIAQKLGIQTEELWLGGDVDGLLVKDEPNKPFKAVANITSHEHRKRFTFAHEIGHYIHKYQKLSSEETAGKVEKRDELSSKGTDAEEIWANGFAAALLMPAAILRRHWANGESREDLAKLFDVSPRSMDVRLTALGLR